MALGAKALAEFARVVAERCPVLIGLHTDHCPPGKLDGYLRPLLAESIERSSPTQWVFHLHRDARFGDGSTLTARDVKYTYDSVMDLGIASPRRASLMPLKSVDVLDDYTVRITTGTPLSVRRRMQSANSRWSVWRGSRVL